MCCKRDMARTRRPDGEKVLLQRGVGQRFHTGFGISLRSQGTRARAEATTEENGGNNGSQCSVDTRST